MKKLYFLMAVNLAILALYSCLKKEMDQPEGPIEFLLNQNPEYTCLHAGSNNVSMDDIIAALNSIGV